MTSGFTPSFPLGAYLQVSKQPCRVTISQLNSSPFRSKIIAKQLEFTVLVLCISNRGSDQCLGGKLKQEPEYCWENSIEDFTPEDNRKRESYPSF